MTKPSRVERVTRAAQQLRPPSLASIAAKLDFPYRAPTVPEAVELPEEEPKTGAHYDSDWARRFPARYARFFVLEGVLRPVVAVVAQPERRGIDRLDGLEGPVIFAANHHSHVDAGLLMTSLPEPFRYKVFTAAAADYFFRNRVTGAASALALNAIPIERAKVTRRSANEAAELIDAGWNLAIFPEGGRSPDGWGQSFRGGAAYLAIRCAVPVVPVHLQGTGRILPKGGKRLQPGRTVVTFGTPIRADEGESSSRFAARLEAAVTALADEATTDWYTARKRAHAAASPSLTGPEAGAWRRTWALGDRRSRRTRAQPTGPTWPDLS